MNRVRSVLFVLVLFAGPVSTALAQPPTEYQVKAAFLYNFTRFVEWPPGAFESARSPFVLGVLGDDPFGPVLPQTVQGKTVKGRNLEVRHFSRIGKALRLCHILFISPSEKGHMAAIRKMLAGASVLTVGETEGFCQAGGIVNFVLQQSRVRFEINPGAAERAGLQISSRLLKLARIVDDGQGREKK